MILARLFLSTSNYLTKFLESSISHTVSLSTIKEIIDLTSVIFRIELINFIRLQSF